jgi:guanylate kinase
MTEKEPKVLLVAGPQGVGKSYLARRLVEQRARTVIAPGVVTRPARALSNGNDRHVSVEEFERLVASGEICLEATIHGHHYGYLKSEIDRSVSAGSAVIILLLLAEDVTRAKGLWPDGIAIYLRPIGAEILQRRLNTRNSYASDDVDLLLSEGMRHVHDLDQLDWSLIIEVSDDTDATLKVLKYLTAIR